MGTNMAAGNQQKHLSLSFATKGEIYLSRNSKTIKIILFPLQELFRCPDHKGLRVAPHLAAINRLYILVSTRY